MTELFSKLGNRLVVLFLIISLIPTVALSSYLYFDQVNAKNNSVKTKLSSYSESFANRISLWLEERKGNIISMASNDITVSKTNILTSPKSSIDQIFEAKFALENNAKINHDNYDWLLDYYISDIDGKILFDTSLISDENIASQDHFTKALSGETAIGRVHKSDQFLPNEMGLFDRDVPTLLISSPIKSEVKIIGVLTARVNFFKIPQFDFNNSEFQTLDVYLFNSEGYLLSKPRFYQYLEFDHRPELESKIEDFSFEKAEIFKTTNKKASSLALHEYNDYLGNNVVSTSIFNVPPVDWHVIAKVAKNEAFSQVFNLEVFIVSFIMILVISIIIISILLSKKLVEPIEGLIESVKKISYGDLDSEIKHRGQDEIKKLATAFEDMRISLKESTKLRDEAELKYKLIYENAPALYRTVDTNGIIKDCNNLYATRLGYTKDEVIGMSILEHVSKKDTNKMSTIFEEWKKKRFVSNQEIRLKTKDGKEFPVLLSATSLYDSAGNLIGSNTILKDISDIRIMEDELTTAQIKIQRQRFETIGELAARMAHDIRNPLAIIKTQISILKMGTTNELSNVVFERINRSIDRIAHQIDHVMGFIKDKQLNLQHHKIKDIINGSLESLTIPSTVSIILSGEDLDILCDAKQMEVVFSNLILNSIQAMKKVGSIYIGIDNRKDSITIEVEDSGPGIPEKDLQKIFDPLFTTKMEGTGLGLTSCKKIIEQHHGTITASSKPTKFIMQIPKRIPPDTYTK